MPNINKRVGYKGTSNPGDCNDVARQRAGSRTPPPSKAFSDNYDEINWKSKQKKS